MSVFKALLATAIFAAVSATASAEIQTNDNAELVYEDGLVYQAAFKADGSDANAHPTNQMTEKKRVAYLRDKWLKRQLHEQNITMAELLDIEE